MLREGRVLDTEPFPGTRVHRLHFGLELKPADLCLFRDADLRVPVASVCEHEDVGPVRRKDQGGSRAEAFVVRMRRDHGNPVIFFKDDSLSHSILQAFFYSSVGSPAFQLIAYYGSDNFKILGRVYRYSFAGHFHHPHRYLLINESNQIASFKYFQFAFRGFIIQC